MIRLIRKWLGICNHEYQVFNTVRHTWEGGGHLYTMYHCQCKKCGDIKGVKIK